MSTVSFYQDLFLRWPFGSFMIPDFLESRSGRPWNYDRDGDVFEFYQGKGPSPLKVVVDHSERPTKQFPLSSPSEGTYTLRPISDVDGYAERGAARQTAVWIDHRDSG